jgi:TalC/MipB family fructose-6-phosphate aldolase
MALFIDSAYLQHITEVARTIPVAGVTTNPGLLLAAREQGQHLSPEDLIAAVVKEHTMTIFMQPGAREEEEMFQQALGYIAVEPEHVIPKIPMTHAGLRVAARLKRQGRRLAFTAVTSVTQAYCAAMAGADYIIPYFNRLERSGINACERVTQMARVLAHPAANAANTRILVASLKTPAEAANALLSGAHDLTVTPNVLLDMARDPLTEQAIDQFVQDWQKMKNL